MNLHKKFVKEKFDRIVKRYDLVNLIGSLGQDKFWRKKVAEILKDAEAPLLDLCCGPYTLTLEILKKKFNKIYGLDFSFSMLFYGKNRIKNKPVYPICGDAEVLPFRDNIFGGISIAFGLRNLPDKEEALKEFFRVLKPGGILVILEFSWPKSWIFQKIYKIYLDYYMPFLGGILTGDREAYLYLANSIKKFPPPYKIKAMLKESGFKEIENKALTMGIVNLYIAKK